MAVYRWATKIAWIWAWFNPWNLGCEWQVLTRTQCWYEWCDNVTTPKYWFVDVLVVWGGWWWGGWWGSSCVWWGWWAWWVVYAESYPLISTVETVSVTIWGWWSGSYSDGSWCDSWNAYCSRSSCFKDIVAYWWWQWWWIQFASAQIWASWWWWWSWSYDRAGAGAVAGWWCWNNWANWVSGGNWGWGWWAGSAWNWCNWWSALQYDISWTMQYYWGGWAWWCSSSATWWIPGCWWWCSWWNNCPWCNATWCWWWGWWAWYWKWWTWWDWVVIVRYKTDGSCWVLPQSYGWCKYTCWDYTIHCFTAWGTFTPVYW